MSPFTTAGKEWVAALIGSSGVQMPGWVAVGSGSGTAAVTNTALIAETDRNAVSTINVATPRKITYTADFSSVEMSGLGLTEFGLGNLVSGGSIWLREGFSSQTFDGTNEAQIQITLEVI